MRIQIESLRTSAVKAMAIKMAEVFSRSSESNDGELINDYRPTTSSVCKSKLSINVSSSFTGAIFSFLERK